MASTDTFVCGYCDEEFPRDEVYHFHGLELCEGCWCVAEDDEQLELEEDSKVACETCNRRVIEDDLFEIDEMPLCRDCYDRQKNEIK